MWLINTETLGLQEFHGDDIPEYIILSHRWGKDTEEVNFKDFNKGKKKDTPGYKKIFRFCKEARLRASADWAWVDSCCIDKRNSAELSEAINSMYRWYKDAKACFVYLPDVDPYSGAPNWILPKQGSPSIQDWEDLAMSLFRRSEWFRRGWTLQELLAPQELVFFSTSWHLLGSVGRFFKSYMLATDFRAITGKALLEHISKAANIPLKVLDKRTPPHQVTIAEKMSWLANRRTKRKEDMAYCALGLLGVHIPLLYGEGEHAFIRLQEELIRTSNDESLFAWPLPRSPSPSTSMLALDPILFRTCEGTKKLRLYERPPYSLTNNGLELRLKTHTAIHFSRPTTNRSVIVVPLNCGVERTKPKRSYACTITLEEQHCGHYERIGGDDPDVQTLEQHGAQLIQEDLTVYAHLPSNSSPCLHEIDGKTERNVEISTFAGPKRVYTIDDTAADEIPETSSTGTENMQDPPDHKESEPEDPKVHPSQEGASNSQSQLAISWPQSTSPELTEALAEYFQDYWVVRDEEVTTLSTLPRSEEIDGQLQKFSNTKPRMSVLVGNVVWILANKFGDLSSAEHR